MPYDNEMDYLLPLYLASEYGDYMPKEEEGGGLEEYLRSLGIVPQKPEKRQIGGGEGEELSDEEIAYLMNSIFRT